MGCPCRGSSHGFGQRGHCFGALRQGATSRWGRRDLCGDLRRSSVSVLVRWQCGW
jgi:hypothetical protein